MSKDGRDELRNRYAALVMGIIILREGDGDKEGIADRSFKMADAMLAARENKP